MAELLRLLPQRQFYSGLTQSINHNAHKEVYMDFYILEKDRVTDPIFSAIEKAARRGVKFQIHVDHFISLKPSAFLAAYRAFRFLKQLQLEGLPVEIQKNIHQEGDHTRNPFRRNHKKVAIIDAGEENGHAYVGGSNLAGRFIPWRDSMVETGNDVATVLKEDFIKTWEGKNSGFHRYKVNGETEILSDSKDSEGIQQRALEEIAKAKQKIWLETTYADTGRIQKALIEAKRKNPQLDVKIFLPHPEVTNDPRFHHFPGHWLNAFAENGIEVYLYGKKEKQFTHAKTLLTDTVAITGSSNFADEVLAGCDAEVVMVTSDQNFRDQAKKWFESGLEHAERYQRKKDRRR